MVPSDDHFPTASATTTMDERIEGVGVGGIKVTSNHIVIPTPSILVDTVQILNACEDAEVGGYVGTTGSCDDFNDEGGVRSSNDNNGDESVGPRFVLVTELACLLHLNERTHANHLWERYRHLLSTTSSSSDDDNNNDVDEITSLLLHRSSSIIAENNDSIELLQFRILWKATSQYIQRHDYIQCHRMLKLISKKSNSLLSSSSLVSSNWEPLATYASELIQSLRLRRVKEIEIAYSIVDGCRVLPEMGFCNQLKISSLASLEEDEGDEEDKEAYRYLRRRGWIPYVNDDGDKDNDNDVGVGSNNDDRNEGGMEMITYWKTSRRQTKQTQRPIDRNDGNDGNNDDEKEEEKENDDGGKRLLSMMKTISLLEATNPSLRTAAAAV